MPDDAGDPDDVLERHERLARERGRYLAEHHTIAVIDSLGDEGVVTCGCGWSLRLVGPREALLDAWTAHVASTDVVAGEGTFDRSDSAGE